MQNLLRNVRFYVLLYGIIISGLIYWYITSTIPSGSLQIIRLTQVYALIAAALLYVVLLAGPLCFTFKSLPFRGKYLKARRSLGVLTFYYGLLHACFAFFGQLGGFQGLAFLDDKYLTAILLSFTALCILFLMFLTSTDWAVKKLTFSRWKLLHRFVYLAAILTLIHALLLGTHFADLSELIPQISFVAISFLLVLEGIRIDAWLSRRFTSIPKLGLMTVVVACLIVGSFTVLFLPTSNVTFNVHAQHILLAQQAQNGFGGTGQFANNNQIPGLTGDPKLRFTESFLHPDNVLSNQPVQLSFQTYNASSGERITLFNRLYEKNMHLIIVDNTLTYFTHVHPDLNDGTFSITQTFPKDGTYHLYTDFQPFGGIEQQFGFSLLVGQGSNAQPNQKPDINLTKTFGNYEVTMTFQKTLIATQMSVGQQKVSFTIKNAKTKEPITTLKPYLAAYGHLVMINENTYDYLHVHPTNLRPPSPDANGGPTVEFLPLGLYGPIKPGIYRVFAQFNPDNHLFTADFTVEIQ